MPPNSQSTKHQSQGVTGQGHPQIEDELDNARSYRYNEKDLTRALVRNSGKDLDSLMNQETLQYIRKPVQPCKENEEIILKLLETWFPILDQTYFFGLLAPKLNALRPIKIYSKPNTEDGYWNSLLRTICVNAHQGSNTDGGNPGAYVETLLHEMLHAFLHVYSCKCARCKQRKASKHGGRGDSAHGATWANAMVAMENSLDKEVSWDVDCGIEEGVRLEMRCTKWQPGPEQFERWGLEYIDVDEMSEGESVKEEQGMVVCNVM